MNLVSFSIRTKGINNFVRRLWTVFTRFGFTEARTRRALHALIDSFHTYDAAPTFFIPAVVLRRHPALISEIAACGAEIGIHGYVHNDYRLLSRDEQYQQTRQAMTVFRTLAQPFQGFRNPYLGWTEEALDIFASLGFIYESNEAVIHDVVDVDKLVPALRSGYEKSLELFQAVAPSAYTLRPYFDGPLLRIPTSIPDDEMLFDRLRMTNPIVIGAIWSKVMQRVYDYGGVYALNLHPERGVLCRMALDALLHYACHLPQRVWLARLDEIAQWWKERSQFRLSIEPLAPGYWMVEASCTPRATLLARHLIVDYRSLNVAAAAEDIVCERRCIVQAAKCPCIGLSPQTPEHVLNFLYEQGYPAVRCPQEEADSYSCYLDLPQGLGTTRVEQRSERAALIQKLDSLEVPFLYFGRWPDNCRAALSISGDIDSVTIQDFFLRILEVSSAKATYVTVPSIFNKEKLA